MAIQHEKGEPLGAGVGTLVSCEMRSTAGEDYLEVIYGPGYNDFNHRKVSRLRVKALRLQEIRPEH